MVAEVAVDTVVPVEAQCASGADDEPPLVVDVCWPWRGRGVRAAPADRLEDGSDSTHLRVASWQRGVCKHRLACFGGRLLGERVRNARLHETGREKNVK